MSRLYEALQRADQERKNAAAPEEELPVVAPLPMMDLEEPHAAVIQDMIPDRIEVPREKITQHVWTPSTASFPTLADRGEGVEQFRSLRSRIYQARYEAPVKTILISSGMPSEGKSFIAANLAMNLARNTVSNILLIDGDLRRPTLHSLLGAPNTPGLTEYLEGKAELKDILQRDGSARSKDETSTGSIANLTFIPAGNCGDNSSELVANHRINDLITALAPQYDWILIDSPPVLAVTDAVELAHAADAVLLIARGARTPFDVAQRTQAAFSNARILGFVLNDIKSMPKGGYNYYDYNRGSSPTTRPK